MSVAEVSESGRESPSAEEVPACRLELTRRRSEWVSASAAGPSESESPWPAPESLSEFEWESM